MNYPEYYQQCKEKYKKSNKIKKSIYDYPVVIYDENHFSKNYYNAVSILSELVKNDFDNNRDCTHDGIMIIHENIWKFKENIDTICNILLPFLQEARYGCNLYVDKIYIYRTTKIKDRKSSYLWHYDNNPNEIVKNLIYLNDVDCNNSPFEFLTEKTEKRGILAKPTRTGPNNWIAAPNNSRITEKQIRLWSTEGSYEGNKVSGKMGTTISFVNNAIHRANPINNAGFRDVINIRVCPTLTPAKNYSDPRWTTSFEKKGVVSPHPQSPWELQHFKSE